MFGKCYVTANVDKTGNVILLKRVLIVCVGNICRSPTAEYLLRGALVHSDIEVSSAGLAALAGKPIEPTAHAVLKEHGHQPDGHEAVQLTPQAVSEADLILVMERRHVSGVLNIAPEARGKVLLLGKWQDDREISDPYRHGKPAFVHAYALIEEAVLAWAQRLAR
ncbi:MULTISPECIES: low molecular weight protein-tyrosine-phosphatase [Pseudomonas]|uniref:protein-tyrosine-phosphatase n=1 Tax=Pseudomonas lini TaxID=163011 RepID=A0A423IMU3_9PSED|nr:MULTISPECIES: low molecular weight protein-tyrosine-phosphatase [Pseudomonas]MBK5300691.1 low molecular weight phosphotyrosine protein phosphatase [Bacillus sp. TH86]MBK5320460.1 low molecular weight phosphotyrosine protein phosphatase [Bacillus sp. TH59]MBK5335410.1 low molecular weight phosphotyrosine protein phosphatase [Bacillus sp. TH57]MBK5309497.1 low molecular weight phosphotyrosine protein phosphatase [Pseudomonas sp. TH71]MBK5368701.1 low molecular weight phosphotyrosine protein p